MFNVDILGVMVPDVVVFMSGFMVVAVALVIATARDGRSNN